MKCPCCVFALWCLWMGALTVAAADGNDHFANRKRLTVGEGANVSIRYEPFLSTEPLDPLWEQVSMNTEGKRRGSLWWEWTAPADGWFFAGAESREGEKWTTAVFRGEELNHLIPVKNGNARGTNIWGQTLFPATAGQRYQIGALARISKTPEAGNPVLAALKIVPAPGPPSNDKLERRNVLAGQLPLKVTGSNVGPPTLEAHLIPAMTALWNDDGENPLYYGPVQWWEWTCPESGRYVLSDDHEDVLAFVAKRRPDSSGGQALAGEWETGSVPTEGETFHAVGGAVYDIAMVTRHLRDAAEYRSFDLYSFELSRMGALPSNTTRASAAVMPAEPLSEAGVHWPGLAPLPGEPEMKSFWWTYTAPVDGLYSFRQTDGLLGLYRGNGPPIVYPDMELQVLKAGEQVWAEVRFFHYIIGNPGMRIEWLGALEENDMIAQAVDLGSQTDWQMNGYRTLATVEQGEPPTLTIPHLFGGSLWWKWTAPGNGWIRRISDTYRVLLEVFEGPGLTAGSQRMVDGSALSVEAGKTYLIRAIFRVPPDFGFGCTMKMNFLPKPSNVTWQTAVEVGATVQPSWQPAIPWPPAVTTDPQWFRWTALESGRYAFESQLRGEVAIFTNPSTQTVLPRDEATDTWTLEAGRSYWMRYSHDSTNAWFEMRRLAVTANGDIPNAMTVNTELPAAAVLTTRGDVNSSGELLALINHSSTGDVGSSTPAVWCKWQPAKDQRVRCFVDAFSYPAKDLFIYEGVSPAQEVITRSAPLDRTARYFEAKQGRTYWFALIGEENSSTRPATYRLELWPVEDVPPANDHFANRQLILPGEWLRHTRFPGTSVGSGGANPLRFEWTEATLEPGEISLFVESEGQLVPQTSSTWWRWSPQAGGIYRVDVSRRRPDSDDTGSIDHEPSTDLTTHIYTGDSLENLQPVLLYETLPGSYCFRAHAYQRYSIRIGSAPPTAFYSIRPMPPTHDNLWDFLAVERLEFEDVGRANRSDAGDGVANFRKVLFGMSTGFTVDDPRNAAARINLPRQVLTNGMLELRCRPDPMFQSEGRPAGMDINGDWSYNLMNWNQVFPEDGGNGELVIRVPMSGERKFLRWDVFAGPVVP